MGTGIFEMRMYFFFSRRSSFLGTNASNPHEYNTALDMLGDHWREVVHVTTFLYGTIRAREKFS